MGHLFTRWPRPHAGSRGRRSLGITGPNAAVVTAMVLSASGACGGGPLSEPSVVVTDSAGVQIVTTRGESTSLQLFATVGGRDLTIGVVDGPVECTFGSIAGVHALPDGGIVVADRIDGTVRIYDATGTHRASTGRRGDGPGEFRGIGLAGVDGVAIHVWDERLRRITRLSHDGALLGSVTVGIRGIRQLNLLPDGGYVGLAPGAGSTSRQIGSLSLTLDSMAVIAVASDGMVTDTLTRIAGVELVFEPEDGRPTMRGFRPFGGGPFLVANEAGGVTTAWSGVAELVVRDAGGALVRRIRTPWLQQPPDPADVARLRSESVENARNPAAAAAVERIFEEVPLPELAPAFSAVRTDADGNYWLAEASPWPAEVTTWTVLSATGEPLGRAELPERVSVVQIGRDWLLGVVRDELDVAFVVRYRLDRIAS